MITTQTQVRIKMSTAVKVALVTLSVGGMAAGLILTTKIATPVASPKGGTYNSPQVVTLSSATRGVTIYYTTDGTTPNKSSTVYSTPITVSASQTIKAIAAKKGKVQSAVMIENYVISVGGDITAPTVTAFSITPTTIDTTNSDQTLTLTATITDDMSGVCLMGDVCTSLYTQVRLESVSLPTTHYVDFVNFKKVSGTANDYVATVTIKQGEISGAWRVGSFTAMDKIGNMKGYSYDTLKAIGATGLDIMNNGKSGDITAPTVTAFSITPTTIDTTNSDQTLTLTATITDDMSGVCLMGDVCTSLYTQVRLESVSLPTTHYVDFVNFKKVSGTANDYVATVTIKQGEISGAWRVGSFTAMDKIGNMKGYSYDTLKAIGATGLDIMNNAQ